MKPAVDFPRLTRENHRFVSPATSNYNCIAWAVGDTEHWWQPGVYWPIAVASDAYGIDSLEQAYRSIGFELCADDLRETGFEKIALYGSGPFYTHAARQLPDGRWTSKLGRSEDIEHDSPDDLAGGVYGEVARFMKRLVEESVQRSEE